MSITLGLRGLDGLAKDIADLPGDVRAAWKPRIVAKANDLRTRVQGEYDARGVSSVGDGMHVEVDSDPQGLGATVVNPSPKGHLWEQGTANRYDDRGAFRGRMPAGNVLVPARERARAELAAELEAELVKVGR